MDRFDKKQKWGGSPWHHPISATSRRNQSKDFIAFKVLGSTALSLIRPSLPSPTSPIPNRKIMVDSFIKGTSDIASPAKT